MQKKQSACVFLEGGWGACAMPHTLDARMHNEMLPLWGN